VIKNLKNKIEYIFNNKIILIIFFVLQIILPKFTKPSKHFFYKLANMC